MAQPHTENRENRRRSTCGFLFAILGVVTDSLLNVVDGLVSWQPGRTCTWRLGLNTRFFQHLLGVRKACRRLVTAQHTGDLCDTSVPSHLIQMRLGNVAGLFTDHVMLVGHDRNLRQVRYDDDLMRSGEICQHAREGTGSGAANTGIDLIKHKRIDTIGVTQNHLARQHDAAQLAARRNAAQGTRCQAGADAI